MSQCPTCGSTAERYEVGNTGLLRCPDCFATTHPEPKPKAKPKKGKPGHHPV